MKLCECGCGNPAPIAKRNHSFWGWIKGEPMRFIRGHGNIGGRPISDGPLYIIDKVTGCWIWQGSKDKKGYGVIKRFGKNHKAHRYFYEEYRGTIPAGLQIDHNCRMHPCVNPDHLEVVNNAENCRRGSNAKLNKEQVLKIKEDLAREKKQVDIAREFGVVPCTINDIAKGRAWT